MNKYKKFEEMNEEELAEIEELAMLAVKNFGKAENMWDSVTGEMIFKDGVLTEFGIEFMKEKENDGLV